MGYEYMLDFEVSDRGKAEEILRRIPGFEGFNPKYELYSFRREAIGAMPDADAKIESSGIYVCSYGGSFAVVLEIQAAFATIGLRAELREL